MFHSGGWHESVSRRAFETVEPATGRILARVADGGPDDLALALASAEAAFPAWAAMPVASRADLLSELGQRVLDRADALGHLDAVDTGSPITAMTADARKGGSTIRYCAGLVGELKGSTYPWAPGTLHYTTLEPWGVVARITAFNHPLLFACARLAPALAAGNCVLLKPSELAPLGPLALAELASDILPAGVLSVLPGGPSLGQAIASHPSLRRLSFTGSVATGLAVSREAADAGVVKTLTLELGGKNPIIVFPDVDIEEAARAVVRGMNFTRVQGQSCGSTSRLLVHRDIHDALVRRVVALAGAIRIGPPTDPATEMGSLISHQSRDRCVRLVASAVADGGRVVLGGGPAEDPGLRQGAFMEPTIIDGVPRTAVIAREEVFGPVLTVSTWTDRVQAVVEANDSPYGLTASIWTRDLDVALSTASALEAGYVWVNDVETRYLSVPFGGWKDSGTGLEQGLEELLSFTRTRSINVRYGSTTGSAAGLPRTDSDADVDTSGSPH
jgi:acyl-CoA reductase-like NAD-dependent aldehyde dehydrogenase